MKKILLIISITLVLPLYGFAQPVPLKKTIQQEKAEQQIAPIRRTQQTIQPKPAENQVDNDLPVVGNNFRVFETNNYDHRNHNYNTRNRRFVDIGTIIAVPVAVATSIYQENLLLNNLFSPRIRQIRPQWFYRQPVYRNSFLNEFNRTRYINNYNGRQPVYSLRGNPPLNWGFGFNNIYRLGF